MIHKDTGDFGDSLLLCRHDTSVASNDTKIPVDNDGIDKSKLAQAGAKLIDLLLGMGSRIIGIWHKFIYSHQLHFTGGFSLIRTHFILHLHSHAYAKQALHHIFLRTIPIVLGRAIFFHNLKYLVPQAVCLVHIGAAHIDKG